jgi:cell division protease FtsH
MFKWFKDPSNRRIAYLMVFVVGSMTWLGINSSLASGLKFDAAPAVTASTTSVDESQQTFIVARSNIDLVSWTPTKTDTKAGFEPVFAVTGVTLANLVASNDVLISSAAVNSSTQTIAVALTSPSQVRGIYAATVLASQQTDIIDAITAQTDNLSVVRADSAPPVLNLAQKPGSSRVASDRTGWLAARTATAEGVAATNPYVAAMVAISTPKETSGSPWNLIMVFVVIGGLVFLAARSLRRSERSARFASGARSAKGPATNGSEIPEVTFADVAGCDEAIEEMAELVEFLKDPEKFAKVGARAPRGALLVGPPGTGKTLLARAVAGEAGVPFYSVAGSDFTEMYVGVGAKRVRELFDKARAHEAGAIIFIDEIDAVGRSRAGGSISGGSQETENTLNALLVEMDGFAKSNIIVIAATNRDDILDAALLRPGRLDRKVAVPLPDRAGRFKILQVHALGKPLAESVDLDLMARRSPGMSGAELAQLVNEACLVAVRDNRELVTFDDFDSALATVAMGRARTSAVVTEHDRLITAWHEGGHTVCAMVLPDADDPVSVSIIPRGVAGGVTWMAEGDDLFLTRRRAFARLVTAMGGRAAEEIFLNGEFTSGPHGDLSAATNLAMAMVTQYGMTDNGLMIRSDGLLSTGAKVTDATVEAVEALLAEALTTARKTLKGHRALLEQVVSGLLENDTLTQPQLVAMQSGAKKKAPALPPAPIEYRRPKAVAAGRGNQVERVRFDDPGPKRRVLRLGPLVISLARRNRAQ